MTTQAEALRTIEELERLYGYRIDVILPDGTHRYYSTHCRCGENHKACSATSLAGPDAEEPRILHAIERKPAQCKTCAAPCVCPCHRTGSPTS